MSNLVFPSEINQGLGTGGANLWGFRLPIKKTPSFKTLLQTPTNNMGELGISLTPYPIWIFEMDLGWMRGDLSALQVSSVMQQIVGFYGAAQGKADSWLYFDPFDNGSTVNVVNSSLAIASLATYQFGIGDGTTTIFSLTRNIGAFGSGMNDLIQNWVSGYPLIYIGGPPPTGYTIAYTLTNQGIITFNSAPGNGQALLVQGQFYFRCRFMDDEWGDLEAFANQLWRNPKFRFKSVLL